MYVYICIYIYIIYIYIYIYINIHMPPPRHTGLPFQTETFDCYLYSASERRGNNLYGIKYLDPNGKARIAHANIYHL